MESFGIFAILAVILNMYGGMTEPSTAEDPTEIVETTD
jgi:hypothetical protein